VQDLDFSPFHDNCLGTASADGTLKIWMIPEGGLKANISDCDAELKGHAKKVMHLKWHPTSEFTLASASMEGCVKIWDVQNEHSKISFDKVSGAPWNMQWNYDGSLLAVVNKEKKLSVFDPRALDSALLTKGHEGNKKQSI
jgi:WD40 repeat protein